MKKRIFADIVLFLAVFFAPWYWVVVLVVIFTALFSGYWEAILAGLFLDAMYSIQTGGFYGRFGVFTLGFLFLYFILRIIKKKIRWFS